jgi:hypothetical protein
VAPSVPGAKPLCLAGVDLQEDDRFEARAQLLAVPLTLLLARLAVGTSAGHTVGRIFFSMLQHEMGHAATAWLCGYGAFPSLWVTPHSESRMPAVTVLLAAALAGLALWTWRAERRGWSVLCGAVLLLQLGFTFGLTPHGAEALIVFGGDAGCFVFGAALMATFLVDRESRLATTALRWGFLVIGAFGFADAGATWWAARHDADAIPFGEIEGVGLSDPSRLTETFGWTVHQMVNRYLALAGLSLAVLALLYVRSVLRVRRKLREPAGAQ